MNTLKMTLPLEFAPHSRVRLYQSSQSMTSFLVWRLVSNLCPCSRSTFSDPNNVSLQALSQQSPRRLLEAVMP